MEQMKPDGLETVDINFEDEALPGHVRTFRPLIWHDEASYCVLLGPGPQLGVFGCGKTVKEAIADWNQRLEDRATIVNETDEVGQYIRDTLCASVRKIN